MWKNPEISGTRNSENIPGSNQELGNFSGTRNPGVFPGSGLEHGKIPGSGLEPGKFPGSGLEPGKISGFRVPGWNSEKFPDSSKFRVRTRNSGLRCFSGLFQIPGWKLFSGKMETLVTTDM